MFNQKYMPYFEAVSALTLAYDIRSAVVAAAVASAVAQTLEIPSSKVVSPEAYFNTTHALKAREVIGDFNNVAVLNYDRACDLVRRFWILRYTALHGSVAYNFTNGCFAECVTGIKYVLSPEDLKILDENGITFGKVYQAALTTLNQVNTAQE